MEAYAASLQVSVAALRCAIATPNECKNDGCHNRALRGNYRQCAECRKGWWPGSGSSSSSLRPAGELLLGPSFMPYYLLTGNTKRLCCCPSPTCQSIGYANDGFFKLPMDPLFRQCWFEASGWICNSKDPTLPENASPKKFGFAWWHFPPDRRKRRLDDGLWELVDRSKPYIDSDRKEWPCLVPINAPRKFVEDESSRAKSRPQVRWADTEEPRPDWAPKIVGGNDLSSGGGAKAVVGKEGKRKRKPPVLTSPVLKSPVVAPVSRALSQFDRAEKLAAWENRAARNGRLC